MKKLPAKKYRIISMDPPWNFKAWSVKGEKRSAKKHYKTMSLKDIAGMPIGDIAAKDCVLFLWGIMPMLPDALEVIKAFGFEFKTVGFLWLKQNPKAARLFYDADDIFTGMGYYTRANAEFCLLAVRGKPKRLRADIHQIITAPIREHSRKPTEFYERVEKLFPGPRIDIFSRTQRKGWDSWGAETGKFSR